MVEADLMTQDLALVSGIHAESEMDGRGEGLELGLS
jgi:hypothetical protein